MDFQSDLGCEWGCMQGGEGKLCPKSLGCRCLTSRSNGAAVTLGSMRLALSEGVVWVLPKLSDWLDSAAQVKEKNKSSYQTCYTMLFALLFSIFPTISTVCSTSWKTRTKPCSTGKGFSSGHQMNHSLSKTYFFFPLTESFLVKPKHCVPISRSRVSAVLPPCWLTRSVSPGALLA